MPDWRETILTKAEFSECLEDEVLWEDFDGGVAEALKDAKDFLALAAQSSPTVVVLQEGYHKLQAAALTRQLPPALRPFDRTATAPPPQLYWQPSANLLHPQQLLQREMTGNTMIQGSNTEQVPFAVVERCKVLEVQYVLKELQQPPGMQSRRQQQQQHGVQPSRQQTEEDEELQDGQQRHTPRSPGDDSVEEPDEEPICQCLSVRVVLQRLPAAPPPDECEQPAAPSTWEQKGLEGHGETSQQAYTATFEYPAFTLKSSDYIIPAHLFDRGLSSWQSIRHGDAFDMLWDSTPWRGMALGYRLRRPGDPFLGSPWWSIAIEWEGHSTDRRTDPEDWCYGNPWEMVRVPGTGPPPLPDIQTAAAATGKVGRPVLAAPWTAVGMATAAAARSAPRRQRQGPNRHDDEFVYEEQDDAAPDAADDWDPSDFYYDDDPEDFEIHTHQRRKGSRRQRQQPAARHCQRRTGMQQGPGQSRAQKAAAAAPGELTHTYGRELLACADVCLVCGSSEGTLISAHTGRSGGTCARQYHAGCLLLLNAVGIRSVCLAKASNQQRKQGRAASNAGTCPATPQALQADADQLCDGLLGQLVQQQAQQQQQHQDDGDHSSLSASVLAAVRLAQEAAMRVAGGELVLTCPSHGCHGCQLNGKQEFMVWCCCCWIRVYHHRQCVPYGAEHVQVDGKDFIRCPHCRAANVPVPGTAEAEAADAGAVTAGDDPDAAGEQQSAGAALRHVLEGALGRDAAAVPPAGQALVDPADAAAGEGDEMMMLAEAAAAAAVAETSTGMVQPAEQQQHQSLLGVLAALSPSPQCSAHQQQAETAAPAAAPGAVVLGLLDSLDPADPDQGVDSSGDGTDAAQRRQHQQEQKAVAAGSAEAAVSDDADDLLDALAQVADLDAQLMALVQAQNQAGPVLQEPVAAQKQQPQQQQQQIRQHKRRSDQQARQPQRFVQEQEGQSFAGTQQRAQRQPSDGRTAASGMVVPAWLQLAFEDTERTRPSYVLVPCTADGVGLADGSTSSSPTQQDEDVAAAAGVLATTAAAAGTLPEVSPTATATAAAAAAASDAPSAAQAQHSGLPLASPHTHWLIGSLPKAEAQYKPANLWGCAIIGVPCCPDDSVYGLAVVVDHLPALQHRQQQLDLARQQAGPDQDQQDADAAATPGHAGANSHRVPPQVYLRCSRAVTEHLQPTMHQAGDSERRSGREWQVLVNGDVYPPRQGRSGVVLQPGDVVTVQGMSFKLQLVQ